MNNVLNDTQLRSLRDRGIISKDEVAFLSGDLLVAENVVTRERRVVSEGKDALSESKRVLKG